MSDENVLYPCHPAGGLPSVERDAAVGPVVVDTYAGPIQIEWDPDAAVTPLGHLAFFAEYLKLSGRFDALVTDSPLFYTSPNAPSKRDMLGTAVLSILAGHWRYAHITALRGDTVNPPLLGMTRVVRAPSSWRGVSCHGAASRLSGRHDDALLPLLCRLPLSRRGHRLHRLALLPLPAQPAHGGRDAGGPRHRRQPRDGAAVGSQVRPRDRQSRPVAGTAAR